MITEPGRTRRSLKDCARELHPERADGDGGGDGTAVELVRGAETAAVEHAEQHVDCRAHVVTTRTSQRRPGTRDSFTSVVTIGADNASASAM